MTKKGIILTAIMLSIITAASFSIWLLPRYENPGTLISDYRSELDSVKERHGVIINETSDELKNMLAGSLSYDDFITRAQTSSSQVNSLLSLLQFRNMLRNANSSQQSYGPQSQLFCYSKNDKLNQKSGRTTVSLLLLAKGEMKVNFS